MARIRETQPQVAQKVNRKITLDTNYTKWHNRSVPKSYTTKIKPETAVELIAIGAKAQPPAKLGTVVNWALREWFEGRAFGHKKPTKK